MSGSVIRFGMPSSTKNLKRYQEKRHFETTPEPEGGAKKGKDLLRFVVQHHKSRREHYDFRLEIAGVLKSWAVPKGPSLDPSERRLAVMTEDHPLEYASFEGEIPQGEYGAGTVEIWDEGVYTVRDDADPRRIEAALLKGLERGAITFVLAGKKLNGEFSLVKMHKAGKDMWLLIKKQDEFAQK